MICKSCGCVIVEKKSTCNHCRYIREKQRDPIGMAYRRLKSHAKQRGKYFSITKEEFERFCIETEYTFRKGIYATSLHVDRIDETKGYTIDNIQAITNSENVKKYAKWVGRDEKGRNQFTAAIKVTINNCDFKDVPF